jgi:hypothetical protein
MIEVPRRRALAALLLCCAVFIELVGLFVLPNGRVFAVLGLILVALTLQPTFAKGPRFRATNEGIWFGGGSVIPWSAVKLVYNAGHAGHGRKVIQNYGTSTTIGFEFHQSKTLFKTPIAQWFLAAAAMGEVHLVKPPDRGELLATLKEMQRANTAASA